MRARLVFATATLLGVASVGCFDIVSNDQAFDQGKGGNTGAGGEGGTGGTTNAGGAGGTTTSSTTTVPVECVPSNQSSGVGDECGVFVSSSMGADGNDGTKAKPFATIKAALQEAPGKTVYLCSETFAGEVGVTGSVTVYGGLDCMAEWAYGGDTARSTITAGTDLVPVRLRNGGSLTAFNIRVLAEKATKRGGSSIAILAEAGTTLDLSRSDAEAGDGAAGEDPPGFVEAAASGVDGSDGLTACSAAQVITPEAPTNRCGAEDSNGGPGGTGATMQGGPGGAGAPFLVENSGGGEIANNPCGHGMDSNPAANGAAGAGAKGSLGALNAELGFVGPAGSDGEPGKVGQGGGGGGGAKGGTAANQCTVPNTGGASGGSGGSGGCAGLGGKGGGGGGSSIALVSLGATLSFTDVTLTAKNAGRGGDGGSGQEGGEGGLAGAAGTKGAASALNDACHGGKGGRGGTGGRGGGGLGGHSVGIAHTGEAPDVKGATVVVGAAGDGGLGETMEFNGDPGVPQDVLAL